MKVGDERFNGDDIRRLYEAPVTSGTVACGNHGESVIDFG
jgi:hypothetical protein